MRGASLSPSSSPWRCARCPPGSADAVSASRAATACEPPLPSEEAPGGGGGHEEPRRGVARGGVRVWGGRGM